jgi:hypothetical protein
LSATGFPPAARRKNPGLAFMLTALFGPSGLLCASVTGGLVTLVVTLATAGLGAILCWPVSAAWAVVAACRHDARLAGAG